MKRPSYVKEWPGYLRAEIAALYFDMTLNEFLDAVATGALPLPVLIGCHERWKRVDLDAVGAPVRAKKPWLPD